MPPDLIATQGKVITQDIYETKQIPLDERCSFRFYSSFILWIKFGAK